MMELVVLDNGVETDWYDPIEPDEVVETDTEWKFNNTYHDYIVPKQEGRTVVIRVREEDKQ